MGWVHEAEYDIRLGLPFLWGVGGGQAGGILRSVEC